MFGEDNSFRFIQRMFCNTRRRRLMMQSTVSYLIARRRRLLSVCLISLMMLLSRKKVITQLSRHRSCRRLVRNTGWWENVWKIILMYDLRRPFGYLGRLFGTFWIVSNWYWQDKRWQRTPFHLTKDLPYACIDWQGGDYHYTITEMVGRGVLTVSSIVEEVSQVLVNRLWNDCVSVHMPDSTEAFKVKILDMEELWQFPCCWAAIDGCQIPIKCPPGG